MKNKLILTTILLMLCCMVVQAVQDIDTVWMRQTREISSVSFHPNSQTIAVGNDGTYVGIWDVNTATQIKKYEGSPCNVPCGTISFSKTGKYFVQAMESGFRVYDYLADTLYFEQGGLPSFSSLHITMSPNEKYIAASYYDKIIIWSLEKKEKIKEMDSLIKDIPTNHQIIEQIEFSTDGTHLAFAVGENNLGTGYLKFINLINDSIDFEYPIGAYYTFKYSNDGTKIAFTSADAGEAIKIMDLITKDIINILPGYSQAVSQICFSTDDNYLIIPNLQNTKSLEVWDLNKNKLLKNFYTIPAGYLFNGLSISNNNKYIAAGSGNYLFLFDLSFINDVPNINKINATIVYPNPANNNIINLSFDLKSSNYTIVNLYDVNGQIVKQIENKYLPFGTYKYTVDLSTLINGSYYLKISSGIYNYSQTFIINR